MTWTITVGGKQVRESDEMSAAAWAAIFNACNAGDVPHLERELSPLHCPICRNVFVAYAVALVDGVSLNEAMTTIAVDWSREQVLDAVSVESVKLAETG